MLSKNLFKVFDFIITACSFQKLIPFKYDSTHRQLTPSASPVRKAAWLFQTLVLMFQATFLAVQFVLVSTQKPEAPLEQKCILVFIFIIFWDQSFFEINLWQQQDEIAWLFNQCTKLTAKHGAPRRKSTKVEQHQMAWPIIHIMIFMGTVVGFVTKPTQKQHFFSILPPEYQDRQEVFLICLFLEIVANLAFIHICQFEFLMHSLIIRCQIEWTAECTAPPTDDRMILATLRKYRELTLLQQSFNRCYGRNIEQIKSGMIVVNVANNYVLIKRWSVLNRFVLGNIINAEIFAHTLPPFLYGNAYKIHDNSLEVPRTIMNALPKMANNPAEQKYVMRMVKSLPPLNVKVAGMYFLDALTIPRFLEIIASSTVSMILSSDSN